MYILDWLITKVNTKIIFGFQLSLGKTPNFKTMTRVYWANLSLKKVQVIYWFCVWCIFILIRRKFKMQIPGPWEWVYSAQVNTTQMVISYSYWFSVLWCWFEMQQKGIYCSPTLLVLLLQVICLKCND